MYMKKIICTALLQKINSIGKRIEDHSVGWQRGFATSLRAGGWGRQPAPGVPGGVPLLLTGIRFSHPGRSRELVGAPEEFRKGFRGALGSPEDSFWNPFRRSAESLGAVLDNLSENVVPWKQFGASRRLYFCEKLFRERPKLISYV